MNKGQKGLMPKRFWGRTVAIGNLRGPRGSVKCACVEMDLLFKEVARVCKEDGDIWVMVSAHEPFSLTHAVDCVSLKQARFVCWKYAEELARQLNRGATDGKALRCSVMASVLRSLGKREHSQLTAALGGAITAGGYPQPQGGSASAGETSGACEAPASSGIEVPATPLTPEQDQASHDEAVTEALKQQTVTLARFLPPAIEADQRASQCEGFPQHSAFEALKHRVALGGIKNYLLVGPAGSGKTTLAKNLATDLGLPFDLLSITAGVTESHLLGRILPPKYELVPSPFVRIYSEGGVFLLDEVDAADPNVLLTVNSALANGMLVTPDGKAWKRHPKTYILAAANTWGKGAERGYSGRNQLDRSTRDRFTLKAFEMNYCSTMEAGIAQSKLGERLADRLSILATTLAIRNAAEEKRIEETVSARFVEEAATFIANGATLQFCVEELLTPWSPTDREKVAEITKQIKPFVKLCKRIADTMEVTR